MLPGGSNVAVVDSGRIWLAAGIIDSASYSQLGLQARLWGKEM